MSWVCPTREAAGCHSSSDLPTRPGARLAGAVAPASLPAAAGQLPVFLVLSHAALMAVPSQAQTACTAAMEEDLRLIGGDIATEGLVRICHNGDWQHVVDDRWDLITGRRNDRRYVGSRAWATMEMESTQQGALRARCSGSVVPRVTDRQAFLPDYETRFTREPRHRETRPVKENFAVSPQFRGGPRDCMQTILTQRVVV